MQAFPDVGKLASQQLGRAPASGPLNVAVYAASPAAAEGGSGAQGSPKARSSPAYSPSHSSGGHTARDVGDGGRRFGDFVPIVPPTPALSLLSADTSGDTVADRAEQRVMQALGTSWQAAFKYVAPQVWQQ